MGPKKLFHDPQLPIPYSPLPFFIRNTRLFCYTLIRSLRSRPGDRPRLGDFKSLLGLEIVRNAGGKSEHHRTAGWLTARRGDPTQQRNREQTARTRRRAARGRNLKF